MEIHFRAHTNRETLKGRHDGSVPIDLFSPSFTDAPNRGGFLALGGRTAKTFSGFLVLIC